MILGSHNSMSYLPPKHWWLWPFRFMAKCQNANIQEQYELGARLFDIRIAYDKNGKPHFRHGLMKYRGDVCPIFAFLDSKKDCLVRIILEESADDKNAQQESWFKEDVARWFNTYSNIAFCCGVRKRDWYDICHLPNIENRIKHEYASMRGNKIDDLYPYLYAKNHNRENILQKEDFSEDFLMLDFVDLR